MTVPPTTATSPAIPPGRSRVPLLTRLVRGTPSAPLPLAGWILTTATAVVALWASVAILVGLYDLPLGGAFTVATIQCGAIVLAVVIPRLGTALQMLAIALIAVLSAGSNEPWPTPIPTLIVLLLFLVVIGLRQHWVFSLVVWWLAFGTMVGVIVAMPNAATMRDWGYNLLLSVTASLIVLGASVALGQGRRIRRQLAAARRDVELEQTRRRYAEDRANIARELHDVVAHSMSMVHIQASSARFRLPALDENAAREFDEIAGSSREAMREMRQLLRALRPADAEAPRAPQPQLADLAVLADGAARIGTRVAVELPDGTGLSPVLQLTAYRIVQEAISNAVRHAPGADVRVTVQRTPSRLVVEVVNGLAPGGPDPVEPIDRGGLGLRGMRERVELLGGDLEHGPTARGFAVRAELPTGEGESA